VATDNQEGHNSWFTEALGDYISQPALTIELNEVFTRVKKRVSDATEGKQTPWVISSLTSSFYFNQPSNAETENDPTLTEKWLDDARRREQREDWSEAIGLINRILNKKPGGTLEEAARNRLPYLQARGDAQTRFDVGDYPAAAALYEQAQARSLRDRRRIPGREQLPAQRPSAGSHPSDQSHPYSRNVRVSQESQRAIAGALGRVQGSRYGTASGHSATSPDRGDFQRRGVDRRRSSGCRQSERSRPRARDGRRPGTRRMP
jgi:hypothetical protein